MKQLIQSYRTGEMGLFDVPPPALENSGILIATSASLVSAGTEKMVVDTAKRSLLGKAKARPDLVKQVLDKMRQEGIQTTLERVFNKLDTPIPLGYSCCGKVLAVGKNLSEVSQGDRVACGGGGYANHCEVNYIPKNLFVKIPENVEDIEAAFVTLGAIALQSIRQTKPNLGEKVAVVGLGLIGQLTVQLLKANGCEVLGADVVKNKLVLAEQMGADAVCHSSDLIEAASEFSQGHGVDAIIVCASTKSNSLIEDAGKIARFKGRIVIVGVVGMDVPRDIYYKKELELALSMAYGPGRYDPSYEEKGIDYPYPYVRWTEQRNFGAFLQLVSQGKVTPKKLITHQFSFDNALDAYKVLDSKENYLGIILKYREQQQSVSEKIVIGNETCKANKVNFGLIGAGNFAKAIILPHLKKIPGYNFSALCTSSSVTAHSIGHKYKFGYITTDNQEILSNQDLNALLVATRHNSHAEYVLKAIAEQKHIFVEKPLCINEEQLEKIKSAYTQKKPKTILQVGFNRRFSPMIQQLQNLVKGKAVSIYYRINAGIIPMDSWIQDKELGGGRIVGEVCHFVDTCAFVCDAKITQVKASCVHKEDKSIPDEDNVHITLDFANGSVATICYNAYGNRQLSKEYIEVFGRDLAVQMDNFRTMTVFCGNKRQKIKSGNQEKGFHQEFCAFEEAIKSGKAAINFDCLYNVTMTTFKALESLKSGGQAVKI